MGGWVDHYNCVGCCYYQKCWLRRRRGRKWWVLSFQNFHLTLDSWPSSLTRTLYSFNICFVTRLSHCSLWIIKSSNKIYVIEVLTWIYLGLKHARRWEEITPKFNARWIIWTPSYQQTREKEPFINQTPLQTRERTISPDGLCAVEPWRLCACS